jgi:hypothetical protein
MLLPGSSASFTRHPLLTFGPESLPALVASRILCGCYASAHFFDHTGCVTCNRSVTRVLRGFLGLLGVMATSTKRKL